MIRPPGDHALDELFDRLGTRHDWLSGYFSALALGPDSVATKTWMDPLIDKTAFESHELPGAIAVLLAMHDAVAGAMRDAPERAMPELTDVEGVTLFASGFVSGARLHPTWLKDELALLRVFPFGLLAGEVPDGDLKDLDEQPITDKEAFFARHRAELLQHLLAVRDHWAMRRLVSSVGRNDPCPCGSGKKYKKCCLDKAS